MIRNGFLTAIIMLLSFRGICQDRVLWANIESAIQRRQNLAISDKRLQDINIRAQQQKDFNAFTRSVFDRILIRDLRTEDTLYFRNSACLDSMLLNDRLPTSLKTLLHLKQAQRLASFSAKLLRFNRARYETPDQPNNYAGLSETALDSAIQYHFTQAKAGLSSLPPGNLSDWGWLASDPGLFLFPVTLPDIVHAEQIRYAQTRAVLPAGWKSQVIRWIPLSPDQFISALDGLDSHQEGTAVLLHFREWLRSRANLPNAYSFIETLVRKYLYQSFASDTAITRLYESYLQSRMTNPYPETKAHAIYQLCLLWNQEAAACEPDVDESFDASTHPSPRPTPARALQLYESDTSLFMRYPLLKAILDKMKAQVLSSNLLWKMTQYGLPGEPMLGRISYKNISRLYYRIIKCPHGEALPVKPNELKKILLEKDLVREADVLLPLPNDHATHSAYLKVDALTKGRYYLLFSNQPISSEGHELGVLAFTITQLSIVGGSNRVYVLNRSSGRPVAGASVAAIYTAHLKKVHSQPVITHMRTNDQGSIQLPRKENYHLQIVYGDDTLSQLADAKTEDITADLFDRNEESLIEFYQNNASLSIFTDRSIYRPGQTVFYKAVLLTKSPTSGEPILFNSANLRGTWWTNLVRKWQKKENPILYVKDPFDRAKDTIPIHPDEYGAFSGSFIIPTNASTGTWNLEPEIIRTAYRTGSFKVENYKRPSFEITVSPPEKTFRPDEPISFSIRTRSFSGASMANTRIAYRINRGEITLLSTRGLTGADGMLQVSVKDTSTDWRRSSDSMEVKAQYSLEATATDLTGESHDIQSNLQVSSRPVRISFRLKEAYQVAQWEPVYVSTKDPNGLSLSKTLQVKIFRLPSPGLQDRADYSRLADQWIFPRSQWEGWFPGIRFTQTPQSDTAHLIYETSLHTGGTEKLSLPHAKWPPGNYRVDFRCVENGRLTGQRSASFVLFDTRSEQWPTTDPLFLHLPYNFCNPGDNLRIFIGSAYDSGYFLTHIKYYSLRHKKLQVFSFFSQQKTDGAIHELDWPIPSDATDQLLVTSLFVHNDKVYKREEEVSINRYSESPQIVIEQYRDRLAPGETTRFTVSVRTKNKAVAAELLSVMYDASLDRLIEHTWVLPALNAMSRLQKDWPFQLNDGISDYIYGQFPVTPAADRIQFSENPLLALEGRVPGLSVSQANGLDKVVKGEYETTTQRLSTGNIAIFRSPIGLPNLGKQALVLIDGIPYTGDPQNIDLTTITDGIVLRGADATAIYGALGAHDVLLLSTKGPLQLPAPQPEPLVKIRNNFNETAFFFPAVHADKDGFYHFTFTMPESVAEWNWRILAHTKKAGFALTQRTVHTVLPLMIQPYMPRILSQGDQVTIRSRVANFDSVTLKGKATCQVLDALTGEDMSAKIVRQTVSDFFIEGHASASSAFSLAVPSDELHPLKIILRAISGNMSDGEEYIVPVRSTRILAQRVTPFRFSQSMDTLCHWAPLPAGDSLYGIEMSIKAKPASALLNALPWLANFSFDCAEQTFNKMLATITAKEILRTDKSIQRSYAQASGNIFAKESGDRLPGELEEQSMPWLTLAGNTSREHQQLLQLLDTVQTAAVVENHLTRLYHLQNPDGGLSWFGGGASDPYISAYVLDGFGKLLDHHWRFSSSIVEHVDDFIRKLLKFGDDHFILEANLYYTYARQRWIGKYPLSEKLKSAFKNYLTLQWQGVETLPLGRQALLIIVSRAYFESPHPFYLKVQEQLENIRQSAITDDKGMRWKEMADADDLDHSAEETLALLAEAFEGFTGYACIRHAILQWLLQAQIDHHWTSTKATAAVIHFLQQENTSIVNPSQKLTAAIGGQTLQVSDDLLTGRILAFAETSRLPEGFTLRKTDPSGAAGNIGAFYFCDPNEQPLEHNTVRLTKKLYRFSEVSRQWEEILHDNVLHLADKIKIVLTIESSMPLRYVYIDDQRTGALEPENVTSGYVYQKGWSWYQSPQDGGCRFFSEFIPSGRWSISYEAKVAFEGEFINGPSMLQCLYNPEIKAYSNNYPIIVK